jgi:hypothetical protein
MEILMREETEKSENDAGAKDFSPLHLNVIANLRFSSSRTARNEREAIRVTVNQWIASICVLVMDPWLSRQPWEISIG